MLQHTSRKITQTYKDDGDALDELVVSMEDELRGELPLFDGLPVWEAVLDLRAFQLEDLLEALQTLQRVADSHQRLLPLALEEILRVQERATLKQGLISRIPFPVLGLQSMCIFQAQQTYKLIIGVLLAKAPRSCLCAFSIVKTNRLVQKWQPGEAIGKRD